MFIFIWFWWICNGNWNRIVYFGYVMYRIMLRTICELVGFVFGFSFFLV